MSIILDTISHGRHVRILQDDDELAVIIDGCMHSGYTSRVDALTAARRLVR